MDQYTTEPQAEHNAMRLARSRFIQGYDEAEIRDSAKRYLEKHGAAASDELLDEIVADACAERE